MPSARAIAAFAAITMLFAGGHAQSIPVEQQALLIAIEDYAGLTPAFRRALTQQDRTILAQAGVSAVVDVCQPEDTVRCPETMPKSRRIFIRLLLARPQVLPAGPWRCLGRSLADRSGGTYADVYLQPVRDEAAEANLPWMTLLAYATMHETGHLLLGDKAHTQAGIMKAHWDIRDYQCMVRSTQQHISGFTILIPCPPAHLEKLWLGKAWLCWSNINATLQRGMDESNDFDQVHLLIMN